MAVARCSCGQLWLEVEGEPVLNALCHCADCRRRTGSAFGWQAYFLEAQVGAPNGKSQARSVPVAEPQVRHFCPDCGTTLWWTQGLGPGLIGVSGGAFDAGVLAEPFASYSNDQRCDWLTLPQGWTVYP
ncbi:MAG: GFA family protein [Novosphingobium sp.]